MVQQISLYGSIDDANYNLLVSTMEALTGSPPILYSSITTVWTPNPAHDIHNVNFKNQLIEPTRINLARDLPLDLFDVSQESLDYKLLQKYINAKLPDKLTNELRSIFKNTEDKMDLDTESNNSSSDIDHSWALSISDIPAAGTGRKVSVQSISETVILSTNGQSSSMFEFLNGIGYVYDYQYLTVGIQFYYMNKVTIEIKKIWNITKDSEAQITDGGYLIKAFSNVSKNIDIDRINQAETALLSLQKALQGFLELSIPDRKSMDSRQDKSTELI